MPSLSIARACDYAELARFHATFPGDPFGVEVWTSRFHLWWDGNPAFAPDVPRGWVLRDTTGGNTIVGFLGNVPAMFRADGTDVRVFGATTWRVLPQYRGASLQLYLAHVEAGAGTLLFNTTANATVARVLEYLRFASLPSYASGRTWLLPLSARKAASAYLRDWRLPRWASGFAAAPLKLAMLPASWSLGARRSRWAVEVVEHADGEFDALWERTKDRYAYTSVRTAERVNWMAFDSEYFRKTLLGCYADRGLRGYAMLMEARWRGVRVLELVDLWTDCETDAVAGALVAGAWRHAGRNGYELLVLHDYSDQLTTLYRKLGILFTVKDERCHFIASGKDHPPQVVPKAAYLTGLEGDFAV